MYKIVEFAKVLMKDFISNLSKEEIICVDATLGNGNDSLYLAQLLNNHGHVYSYDIQEQALCNSSILFKENNITNVTMKLKSHEYIEEENIDLVIFNLGYLPGSDKSIQTNKDTTIKALNNLLPKMNKENMLIIICLYVGHNEGMLESLLVDQFVKDLSPSEFLVTKYQNYNRPSSPFILTISPNKISKK
jgi:hypothetical protein